jgi:uncharacterized protein (TIGR02246 family)
MAALLAVLLAAGMAVAPSPAEKPAEARGRGRKSTTRAPSEEEVRKAVVEALERQTQAWNRGDLDGFVAVYAEDATFVSPSGLTRGRQAVLDRYRKRYPDKAAMGTLSLEVVEIRLVTGNAGASVVARWTLSYPEKPAASGLTLLVLHPRGTDWAIVQDASM